MQPRKAFSNLWGRLLWALIVVLLATAIDASAQRTNGALKGVITDPQGAVIPGATVTVLGQETKLENKTVSSSAGTFVFPSLLPGSYTLTVEASGFLKTVRKDVSVLSGQDNEANFKINVGSANESIEVVAGADLVQTTTATLTNNYSAKDVVNLPNAGGLLNGSPLNLAVLAPNTTAQPGGVAGTGGSIGGTRPRDNSFNVDGVDDNNLNVTGNNSTVIPDAVAEFSLITNQFSAEYSHSAGGLFNLVTKSGTNNWHGSGELYSQNRNFNANDNLTKAAIASGSLDHTPRFDNNRGGGTIGGPILHNRWFIFGAYEYTDFHAEGNSTTAEGPTAAGLATLSGQAVNEQVRSRLNLFPVAPANDLGTVVSNGVQIPVGSIVLFSPNFQHEHDFNINSDFKAGNHQLGFRYLFNHIGTILPVQTPQPQFNQDFSINNRKTSVTDAWTINNRMVNDLRLAYGTFVQLIATPAAGLGFNDITITNMGRQQTGPADDQQNKSNLYQILDNVTYSRGKHTFKFGGEYRHWIAPQTFLSRGTGDYVYNTLQEFVNDQVPGNTGQTLRGAGSGFFNGTQSAVYWFAQDDFKVTPRLTVNLGLRYEYYTNPAGSKTQALNSIANVPGVITFGVPKTDINNYAPRVGFAWDPKGDGKWAVRGGFGVAYDVKFQNFASITLPPQLQSELNVDSACTLTPQPSWCATGTGFLAGGGLPQSFNAPTTAADARALTTSYIDDTVMPKILNWTLSVQHELYKGATLEARYLGTKGLSLPFQLRRNFISAFDAGIQPLPTYFNASDVPATVALSAASTDALNTFDPNTYAQYGFAGNITADPPGASNIYHAGALDFNQHLSHGIGFRANYTYSHNIDNATNEFFTSLLNPRRAQDGFNLNQDRGNSTLDVRHKFSMSWSYDLPKAKVANSVLKALLHGYQFNGTFVAQSGQPVTPQSGLDANANGDAAGDRAVLNPNGVGMTGSDATGVCRTGTGATYMASDTIYNGGGCLGADPFVGYLAVDPKARFVLAGPLALANAGRNSVFSPGFGIWNMSVFKNTHFTESTYLQLRAEFFNVFNHRNFTIGNGNIFGATGITTATGNPAYAQVADPQFLNAQVFSGGSRTATLGVKLIF